MNAGVESYLEELPPLRRDRIQELRRTLLESVKGVEESMRYRMPTFERSGKWVCIGNQKHHLSVYFCSGELIDAVRARHPRLDTGKGCVRIRDHQQVPVATLRGCFVRALSEEGKA